MTHRTWVEISERALAHNIKQLRSLTTTGARFCAIVKANAYGHDLKTVARIAGREGVDAFGVDTVADALFLREMFPAALIIVLGYTLREHLADAVKAGLHVTAYDLEALRERIACELRPALTWKSRIAQVKMFPTGSAIGYGLSERLKRDSRIAVVPVGYWDGYDRHLSSVGETLVNGTRCRVVGRVCMNMMMIDVSGVPNPVSEQEVILLGSGGRDVVSAGEIAKKLRTSNTKLSPASILYYLVSWFNLCVPDRAISKNYKISVTPRTPLPIRTFAPATERSA